MHIAADILLIIVQWIAINIMCMIVWCMIKIYIHLHNYYWHRTETRGSTVLFTTHPSYFALPTFLIISYSSLIPASFLLLPLCLTPSTDEKNNSSFSLASLYKCPFCFFLILFNTFWVCLLDVSWLHSWPFFVTWSTSAPACVENMNTWDDNIYRTRPLKEFELNSHSHSHCHYDCHSHCHCHCHYHITPTHLMSNIKKLLSLPPRPVEISWQSGHVPCSHPSMRGGRECACETKKTGRGSQSRRRINDQHIKGNE
jgi:hypothetical protein